MFGMDGGFRIAKPTQMIFEILKVTRNKAEQTQNFPS
jgi:hypothetical protein